MGHSEEITRRLEKLRQAAQEFNQFASLIDNNFDGKMSEIKSLEIKRDKLRDECDKAQQKSNAILQDAMDQASMVRKEAQMLMDEANIARIEAKQDQDKARSMIAEAQALNQQAVQRQKEADVQWRIMEEQKKRIAEAVRG